jgi:nucleotide-binding universal stress UspA family protein
MNQVVIPICDTADAPWAARQAIALYQHEPVCIHLVNVQRPLPRHVAQFFNRSYLHDFHEEAGMQVLEPAKRLLDEAGVPHEDHVLVGHQAETIVRFAEDCHCDRVVVDATPRGMLSRFGLGSIASQVQHLMAAQAAAVATTSNPTSAAFTDH